MAERRVLATGRRFATVLRTVVLASLGLVAGVGLTVAVAAVLWSALFAALAPRRAVVWADAAVMCALCLAQTSLVQPEALADSTNWVLAAASITAVTHQWYLTTRAGAVLTAAVVVCEVAGGVSAPIALWTFAEAAMSRGLVLLLRSGARSADQVIASAERTRREAAVASARRADEREQLAVLHDTAASTLFVAGSGAVQGREPWLVERAAQDVAVLTTTAPTGDLDLAEALRDVVRESPLDIEMRAPETVCLTASAVVAVCRAVREALVNVVRHAGVGHAVVSLAIGDRNVVVEVADRGSGFDPAAVPGHHHGISRSIVDRMARVGGRAEVTGGSGTVVRLELPRA
ncbi:Signal transduction histidine kinase [Lentzea xinjiangensis]|uniref:Signal transduction histidine kinase n=1 Tax=Lentzea xinjiangensis TaxID=402600 RepID=A0A1H9UEX8_9PSEU|nr:ATP-binding protein [Lentzea xinjiangensis]SES07821.1 Signal transduction histidine kinase [Lentzea xinjiangensis]